jgi:hypothetical protein
VGWAGAGGGAAGPIGLMDVARAVPGRFLARPVPEATHVAGPRQRSRRVGWRACPPRRSVPVWR